jgi:hypothetical protein
LSNSIDEVLYKFNKVAVALALASCDHQKSKLRAVAGAEGVWVAELRVRQLKIGRKSCFAKYPLDQTKGGFFLLVW